MRKVSPSWWMVFLLFGGTFINAVDRASLSSAAPLLIKQWSLDEEQMGIALSAFFWFYLVMNIPAGRLADRFGAKSALGWAAVLWSLCSAATGAAAGLRQLVAARIGVGVGEAASFPVNAKIVNNHFRPADRGVAAGIYTAGLRLGFAATPLLMAHLIHRWGWRAAFYLTGLGSLAWVALWYFTFPKLTVAEEPASRSRDTASLKIPLIQFLRSRTVIGLILCKFFQDYLLYLFVTWLPGYLVLERGFSMLKTGWYATLPWLAGFLAQPLAGWVSDSLVRRGVSLTVARKSILIVMQLTAASVVIAGFTGEARTAVAILTLSVACESAATSILWTICSDTAPTGAAGSLAGVMNSAGALAGILAPVVTGHLAKSTGHFQLPLLVGGCMIALAAAAMAFVVGKLQPLLLTAPQSTHATEADGL